MFRSLDQLLSATCLLYCLILWYENHGVRRIRELQTNKLFLEITGVINDPRNFGLIRIREIQTSDLLMGKPEAQKKPITLNG
jgi:hypothetical protein